LLTIYNNNRVKLEDPIAILVVEEQLDVEIPLAIHLSGVDHYRLPVYVAGNENEEFINLVAVFQESLVDAMRLPYDYDLVVLRVGGIFVGHYKKGYEGEGEEDENVLSPGGRALEDATAEADDNNRLRIDFAVTTSHMCAGECIDNMVASQLWNELQSSNERLRDWTENGSGLFIDKIVEKGTEMGMLDDDFGEVVSVEPYSIIELDVLKEAVEDSASTKTMSDGSTRFDGLSSGCNVVVSWSVTMVIVVVMMMM